MKPAKLILYSCISLLYAVVAAFCGALVAQAVNVDPVTVGAMFGGASLVLSTVRVLAPGAVGLAYTSIPAGNPNVRVVTPRRSLLEEINWLNKNKYQLPSAIQLPGYLRSEVILGNTNSVVFPIGDSEQAPNQPIQGAEKRLNNDDAFFPMYYGVFFYPFAVDADPEVTALNRAQARLHAFPNDDVFGLNTPAVAGAYNGSLSLRVGATVYMDSLDVMRFMHARMAQQGLALSTVATTGVMNQSDWSGNEMFSHETDPLVRLNGPSKNLFTLTFPSTLDFTAVTDVSVAAVLYLRGWLSQNGGAARVANNTTA